MRVDGLSANAVPVEEYATDTNGSPITGLTNLSASISRASDSYVYDWAGGTFLPASESPPPESLVEVSPALYPGLYHVPGGFPFMPAREETYTVLFEQLGSPLVDVDLPRSHTFKTGQMAGSATLMNNLVDQLSSVADTIRSTLHTTLGMRQYAVFHVKRRWSGARVGMGALSVTAVERLWPDPLVTLKDEHVLTEGGLQEIGTASLSEVSLSYSQDDLIGVDFVSGETLFLLVDQMGSGIIRRAYIPADHPRQDRCDQLDRRISKKTSPIGWVVPLRRVDLPPLVVGVAA